MNLAFAAAVVVCFKRMMYRLAREFLPGLIFVAVVYVGWLILYFLPLKGLGFLILAIGVCGLIGLLRRSPAVIRAALWATLVFLQAPWIWILMFTHGGGISIWMCASAFFSAVVVYAMPRFCNPGSPT